MPFLVSVGVALLLRLGKPRPLGVVRVLLLCLDTVPRSVGPPSPSRDRDGIGRRDYVGKRCCYCSHFEIEVPRPHSGKIGSGPGSIGELEPTLV